MSLNSQVPHEQDFKTDSLNTAKNQDISGRLNASTQNIEAVQGLQVTPAVNPANPRYKNPDSFLDDVKNRYL